MTEQRHEQDVRGQLTDRDSWEDALRGFLIQTEADELLAPPVAGEAEVVRHRAHR